MAGFGGASPGWQVGQIFGLLGLISLLFPGVVLVFKPEGERLHSKTGFVFMLIAAFTLSMFALYIVASRPYYEARARLGESFELVSDVTGLEITEDTNYPRIVTVLGRRAPIWPPNCIPGRLRGSGNAQFDGVLTAELREAVATSLEDDGFRLSRHVFDTGNWSLFAVKGDKSYRYTQFTGDMGVVSRVDAHCGDDLAGLEDCRSFVDSFLDERSDTGVRCS